MGADKTRDQSSKKFLSLTQAKQQAAITHLGSRFSLWSGREHKEPLSKGKHALLLISEKDIKKAQDRTEVGLQALAVRSRYMNKRYQAYIKHSGIKQVIFIGSGLNTRAYEKNSTNQALKHHSDEYGAVKFFEVDSPEVLDYKEKVFIDKALDKNAEYIRVDSLDENFIPCLAGAGVDFSEETLIVWESTFHHEVSEVDRAINEIKTHFNSFVLSFDYFTQAFIDMVNEEKPNSLWKAGFDNMAAYAAKHGLTVVGHETMRELEETYEVQKGDNAIEDHYAVCTLRPMKR